MQDLERFQAQVEYYRKQAPTLHTQRELAAAIHLDKDELSKRLNTYKHPERKISPLSCAHVQAIVRELAKWGAITTQKQAVELLDLMHCTHFSEADWESKPLSYLQPPLAKPVLSQNKLVRGTDQQRQEERQARLRAMQIDHSGFIHARPESFFGRLQELDEVQQLIAGKKKTGGYVTITGPAGQGKSSIIATLIDAYGKEQGSLDRVAYHFIPLNPGPDHQVDLLRNLMARLILKYDLFDFYVAGESRSALRGFLPKVLTELVARGGQEVIFIDGLDQLEEDFSGVRDLSFLPSKLPGGIVFVLATRPDDTLRPLELLQPLQEYQLPHLSRQDFALILQHRKVHLEHRVADQLYSALERNALYLDLLAKELTQKETSPPAEIIV